MSTEVRADASVEFLQKEHAKTLRGLHEEINKLQQKCAKLNFELTMSGGTMSSSDANDDRVQKLEIMVLNNQKDFADLQARYDALEYQNGLLKHERNLMMKKFEEQMCTKNSQITSLHSQISDKSNTIAQLVHKLHQMQHLLHRGTLQEVPTPPSDPPPPEGVYRTTRIARRVRRPNNSALTLESTRETNTIGNNGLVSKLPLQYSTDSIITSGNTSISCDQTSISTLPKSTVSFLQKQTDLTMAEVPAEKPPKSVLPPIVKPPTFPPPENKRDKRPTGNIRRFHLAKNQGLTSAPCSLRLNHIRSEPRADDDGTNSMQFLGDEEGKLLVKHETCPHLSSTTGALLNNVHHHHHDTK